MIGKRVISVANIPLYEVKEIISERNKEGELNYEQQHALDYSKKFSKLTPAKGEKLLKELSEVEGLDDDFIVKAADMLPSSIEVARLISARPGAVSDDTLKKVIEIAAKYAK